MNTALALIEPTQYELMAKLATVAARSGYTANNEVQALFVMLKGFEIGVSPIQALEGIQVIKGKTTVSPQLMLAMINRSGLMEDMKIDGDTNQCTVTMQRVGRSAHTETFTMDNARSMNLAGNHNWKAQPATMLNWRAVSACARVVFPDVIQGMYTPEELGAEVSEDGSGDIVIETPATVIPANFKETEDAVAQLVANNPPPTVETETVIESVDSSKTDLKATPSDLAVSDHPDIATDGKTPAERLGTANGHRIGRWPYDRNQLLTALSTWAKDFSYQERNNTVKKLAEEKAFLECQDINDAVQVAMARLNSHKAETEVQS